MGKKQRASNSTARAAAAAAVSMVAMTGNTVGLSAKQLEDLKQKYGFDIQLKSHSEPLTSIIHQIEEATSQSNRILIAGEHDKTTPGYDRDYNKAS